MSVESMVAQAEKSLGIGEPNYIQSWYCAKANICGNFAWCDASITYWAYQSGNQGAVTWSGYYAYTVAHAQRFKDNGQWHVDVAGIRRGDIVFFDWGGTNSIGAIDHVGLVTGVSGSNVLTIEGNTSNVCARRVRTAADIAGYGRPVYQEAPKPTPPPKPPVTKPVPISYEPYPGSTFFHDGQRNAVITRMGRRLVQEGCGLYKIGPGPLWEPADAASYAKWQRKLGYSGKDANGVPGKVSWDKLKVPKS